MKKPTRLDFSPEEIEALVSRLENQCLEKKDYPLLTEILRAMIWLSFSLKEKELSIKRLRSIFGIKTESAKKLLEFANAESSRDDSKNEDVSNNDSNNEQAEKEQNRPDKKKNHGHRPSSDYTQANIVHVTHQVLKKGDTCPECLKGRLFQLKSGTVIRIVGQPWLQVDIYKPERFRCSLCGRVFTANLPAECETESRSDHAAKAIVTLLKYRGGVPFYRQEQLQSALGAPISASEIWQMTENVADALHPIYTVLLKKAATADLIHNDDTKAKILSRVKELKEAEETPERTGTVTTCILAVLNQSVKIALFFTGWKHAGENLGDILDKRPEDLPKPIQQCDALSHNIPQNQETKVSNCLAHLRRKFYELVSTWEKEVLKILSLFASVFRNDHEAPEDPKMRLKWHQEKSSPIMNQIKEYCDELISEKKVEPNSSLGKAIAYLNNHWAAFTLFLRIPGVPLTNNADEQLIKRAVLNRKNAYFFKNETGAKIADILMSCIETCVLSNINPYDYFLAVQRYQFDVRKNPDLWLPWLYEARLKDLEKTP
ncbi:MAG: IS66 family transposase [Chlamydiia bacterium]|nr:IS66 family transposase [Chlamydiia bacterium]